MDEQFELEFHAPSIKLPQLWTPDDIFKAADQNIIQLFKEDSRVERKVAGIHADALGDYLSMYANTQPHGGVIFIGVENNGAISGCGRLTTEQLNKFETVRHYCPDARHEFKRIPIKNVSGEDDLIIALRV